MREQKGRIPVWTRLDNGGIEAPDGMMLARVLPSSTKVQEYTSTDYLSTWAELDSPANDAQSSLFQPGISGHHGRLPWAAARFHHQSQDDNNTLTCTQSATTTASLRPSTQLHSAIFHLFSLLLVCIFLAVGHPRPAHLQVSAP